MMDGAKIFLIDDESKRNSESGLAILQERGARAEGAEGKTISLGRKVRGREKQWAAHKGQSVKRRALSPK